MTDLIDCDFVYWRYSTMLLISVDQCSGLTWEDIFLLCGQRLTDLIDCNFVYQRYPATLLISVCPGLGGYFLVMWAAICPVFWRVSAPGATWWYPATLLISIGWCSGLTGEDIFLSCDQRFVLYFEEYLLNTINVFYVILGLGETFLQLLLLLLLHLIIQSAHKQIANFNTSSVHH